MKAVTQKLFVCLLVMLVSAGGLQAQDQDEQILDVEAKIYLLDVEQIDSVSQSFIANLALAFRWNDPTLAHEGQSFITLGLDDIWFPRVLILNQQQAVNTFPRTVEVYPDGEVVYRQRLRGSFSQALELREFPFDTQTLKIKLGYVNPGGPPVRFEPSPDSGISDSFAMPDWKIKGWDIAAEEIRFDQQSPPVPGVVFALETERYSNFFVYKAIFPLVLIVLMSWLVFWIDPGLAASQISVAVTSMLTVIAYRFALAGMVPRLPFLTTLDLFVIASTLMVFLSMVEVIYTAHLSAHGQGEKARMIDRHARWIAPLIFLVLASETLYFRFFI